MKGSRKKGSRMIREMKWRYALWGAVAGLFFPILATFIELARLDLPVRAALVFDLHSHTPLLLIIDTAPLFLGGFAYWVGLATQNYLNAQRRLNIQRERYTRALEAQNQDLSEVNQVLDRLVYTASHDLKTPVVNLQSMLHMLRSLQNRPDSEQMIEQVVQRMEQNTEKAQSIISDLLIITNLERENSQSFEKIELQQLQNGLLEAVEEIAAHKKAVIHFDFEACPLVYFSRKNLESILMNLLSNSLKYASPDRKPEIKIKSDREGDYDTLAVTDNGIGMDLDQQGHKLFQMFSRLHATAEGSGIGLYLVKKTLERNGAKIEVASQPDQGSTFKILIPKKSA